MHFMEAVKFAHMKLQNREYMHMGQKRCDGRYKHQLQDLNDDASNFRTTFKVPSYQQHGADTSLTFRCNSSQFKLK